MAPLSFHAIRPDKITLSLVDQWCISCHIQIIKIIVLNITSLPLRLSQGPPAHPASKFDHLAADHFARTVNKLKGQVTMLFITHQVPKGLQVDEVLSFGAKRQQATHMGVVDEQRAKETEGLQ